MEKINVVWFKRDIRTKDHLPLKSALESDLPVLLVLFLNLNWCLIWKSQQDEDVRNHSINVLKVHTLPSREM